MIDREEIAQRIVSYFDDMDEEERVSYLTLALHCMNDEQCNRLAIFTQYTPQEIKTSPVPGVNRFEKQRGH